MTEEEVIVRFGGGATGQARFAFAVAQGLEPDVQTQLFDEAMVNAWLARFVNATRKRWRKWR